MNDQLRIVRLEAENVKRLSAVEITPAGDVVVLVGENGAGKSSVIDSIEYALGGKGAQPPMVIRRGADSARVKLDLGSIEVERKWTSNDKSYLEVRSKDGAAYKSPQALLDDLVGQLSFDPLKFLRLEPAAQVELIRQLAGVHFGDLDAKRAAVYERRTEIGKEGASLKGRLASLPPPPDGTPEEPVSVDELLEEHKRLTAQKEQNDQVRAAAARAKSDLEQRKGALLLAQERVEEAERALANAKQLHTVALTDLGDARAAADELLKQTSALVDPDTSEVYRKIKGAEAVNDAVKRRAERAAVDQFLAAKRKEYEQLTKSIEAIDAEKAAAIAAAKLPVPELSFTDAGVFYKGLGIEQASQAEKLRVSLAMGIALNPKLRVMLIRDASLLDKKGMELVAQMAKEAGVQVWLERVAAPGEVGVIIEDGHVASAQTSAPLSAKTNGKSKSATK